MCPTAAFFAGGLVTSTDHGVVVKACTPSISKMRGVYVARRRLPPSSGATDGRAVAAPPASETAPRCQRTASSRHAPTTRGGPRVSDTDQCRRFVMKNLFVQSTELRSRLNAVTGDQLTGRVQVQAQRVNLATSAVQRCHQKAHESFAGRVTTREAAKVADDLVMAATGQVRKGQLLQRGHPQLIESDIDACPQPVTRRVG